MTAATSATRRGFPVAACSVCGAHVGLIHEQWNATGSYGRAPKIARHKATRGGPWCPGSQLTVPADAVLPVTR